ncbi:nicotinate-nucleotide pyrophosphorylase [carboxylating]-like [Erpetoichthys calabaricus]|uniref:Nicotinate-nucleotide pyrophosphorylase [carboxylating] n=1 Tax=Erpetoichthys calabaricus TaxID=27687 RepID=A0A8C4XA11_ERPCA|nr:nicotinate-nucleotide pyrophosphorylase [carboxylating]-like [Erpetoichthys calabaricus]XP_051790675.1 nicotinate-nucleotide pyrophosphorylase [carboxylating]-like [Erpetoichthys calabaricus]XP_051790676.1 nicotinate-nucleotide pyrophosphorylase [carboxylating]-like [Erpetoichthys calabaricus]
MSTPSGLDLAHLLPPTTLTRLAQDWLAEDVTNFDPAGMCVGAGPQTATLLCKEPGSVLAGVPFFNAVFGVLGCQVDWLYPEGAELGPEQVTRVAVVHGPACNILQGERSALNCLARASGIATRGRQLASVARKAAWKGSVAGTRKTTPGFRVVEKYAMLVGGVATHRCDLSSLVMLKDNHVWACGGIAQAVQDVRRVCGFSSKIEVECRSEDEGREAARAGADIVMLDNFTPQTLHTVARTLKQDFPTVLIEASGGITPETLSAFFSPSVDIISLGCITQGCPVVDFSLKIQCPQRSHSGTARRENGIPCGTVDDHGITTVPSGPPTARRDFAF